MSLRRPPLRNKIDTAHVHPVTCNLAKTTKYCMECDTALHAYIPYIRSTWVDGASYYGDATLSCYVNIYHIIMSNHWLLFTIIRSVALSACVHIAITTLQIRRLLLDDVESANVCIVRCSISSCAPAYMLDQEPQLLHFEEATIRDRPLF